jgi:uncharacterized protein (TIGR03437 family)
VNAIQAIPGNGLGASFVAKFDSTGQNLLFSTYLSGTTGDPFNDFAASIVVDGQGDVWVAGNTGTVDFPLVNPIQSSSSPDIAAYLAELVPSGKGVVLGFSTYLGGIGDGIAALALSPSGSIWLAGSSGPTSSGYVARLDLDPLPPAQSGVPLVRAIYNAAGFQLGDVVSPGEIVSLFGAELAPAMQAAAGYPLPQTLQGVSVTIGGLTAPLYYVSPGQINFQAPFELPLTGASIVVNRGAQSSAARPVRVIPFGPGIFTGASDGFQSPVIVHISDYGLVTAKNPAQAGEYLAIYCTGLGVTGTMIPSGAAAPARPTPVQHLVEVVADSGIAVTYAGLAPGFAGLYQVNIQVLSVATPGAKLLYVTELGVPSNQVYLYVK